MKRSRLYLTLTFLLASQFDLTSAAALRATPSPTQNSPEGNHDENDSNTDNAPSQLTVKLSKSTRHRAKGSQEGAIIPLVGVGVGNSPHHKIPFILASALSPKTSNKQSDNSEDLHYRLVDTSHNDSALEVLVGRSLSRLLMAEGKTKSSPSASTRDEYHLLIKIHHTHLGYERTMLSVQNSLSDILPGFSNSGTSSSNAIDIRVHALIQYPRCYDSFFSSETYKKSPNFPVKHSSCYEEEDALDDATKSAGPSPLIDTENAWRRSWRALEELYHHGTLESIGVSNFGPFDMNGLYEISTEGPHLYQGSLRTLLLEEEMIEELIRHGVHYQCVDAASAVLAGRYSAPEAYATLERIGAKHGNVDEGDTLDAYGYSAVQLVLGWLVQRGVGVFPGTTSSAHLVENSPLTLAIIPKFSPRENLDIETALIAIVNGKGTEEIGGITRTEKEGVTPENVELTASGSLATSSSQQVDGGVVATFFNSLQRNIRIFQVHPETGRQIQLSRGIPPGRSGRLIVEPADVLIAYDGHGIAVKKFLVEEGTSGRVDFTCE
eukprot:CAMPEP_0201716996 /NCGR_PEP_ID=MMETSP0593-20130828/2845_1 /ASSEMBLY_ACC=CAM_ASM_000672 /TAXON_ID=267983 /ORGANISM="Skeletonema japonicum, Strain CCMP2506" /LENGTH=549 /DNA_ID=CAMNT_0048206943 /DNA_START=57 /DNA_END=1706 /DNA_ORIENTATION=-